MTALTDTFPSLDQGTPCGADPPEAVSGATRHLAAGAYLDPVLRRVALREVLAHPKRSVAPSAGFDLAFVLTHCLRARRAVILRDTLEVIVLILCLHAAVLATLELWTGLALWSATVVVLRTMTHLLAERLAARVRADDDEDDETDHGHAQRPWERWVATHASRRPWLAALAACVGSATVVVVLLRLALVDLPLIAGGRVGLVIVPAVVVVAVMVFAIPLGWGLWRQRRIEQLTRGHPAAVPSAASGAMRRFAESTSGNTTVHSSYRPFIGSGGMVHRWAFAVRVLRATPPAPIPPTPPARELGERAREFQEPPFSSRDLIDRFREVIGQLDGEDLPERRIPGLTLRSRVYVPSDEVSRPLTHTEPIALDQIITQPTAPERHYLVVEVVVWDGELVTTVFLHVAVQGMTLYLESTTTALLPCRRDYRIADLVGGTGAAAYVRAVGVGLLQSPSTVTLAPFRLARELQDLSRAGGSRFLVDKRWFRGYDYGARMSIREEAQSDVPKSRPQMQDVVKYDRIIERRILACVVDFFDEHGVDTSELQQRAEMVLNVGVVNAGVVNTGSGTVNTTTAAGTTTTSHHAS